MKVYTTHLVATSAPLTMMIVVNDNGLKWLHNLPWDKKHRTQSVGKYIEKIRKLEANGFQYVSPEEFEQAHPF